MLPLRVWLSLLLLLALVMGGCQPITAPPSAAPLPAPAEAAAPVPAAALPDHILIIGGGWTTSGPGSLDMFLRGMIHAAHPTLPIETHTVYLWGSLQEQWEAGKALEAIRSGEWDVVVLEQDLAGAASNVGYYAQTARTFQEYVRRFQTEIAAVGAQTVLLASPDPQVPMKKNAADFYATCAEVAQELAIPVAPVGHAMLAAHTADPNLTVYGGENVMASTAGLYLEAAVLYATIYGSSPEGIAWLPADDVGTDARLDDQRRALELAPETGDLLLRVAWETVSAMQQ